MRPPVYIGSLSDSFMSIKVQPLRMIPLEFKEVFDMPKPQSLQASNVLVARFASEVRPE